MYGSVFFSCKLCLALFLIASCVSCATPEFELQGEKKIDLGQMEQGDKITFETVVKNAGNANLQVKMARLSCSSCTRYLGEKKAVTIAPNQSHAFKFEFDSAEKRGHFSNLMQFNTNDPKQKIVIISFSGNVAPVLQLSKSMLRSKLPYGDRYSESIGVQLLISDYEILHADSSGDLLAVSLRKSSENSKNHWILDIRSRETIKSHVLESIRVHYQKGDYPPVVEILPCQILVIPPVVAVPANIFINLLDQKNNGLGKEQQTSLTFVLKFNEGYMGKYIGYSVSDSLSDRISISPLPGQTDESTEFQLLLLELPGKNKTPARGFASLNIEMSPNDYYELLLPIKFGTADSSLPSRSKIISSREKVISP